MKTLLFSFSHAGASFLREGDNNRSPTTRGGKKERDIPAGHVPRTRVVLARGHNRESSASVGSLL